MVVCKSCLEYLVYEDRAFYDVPLTHILTGRVAAV